MPDVKARAAIVLCVLAGCGTTQPSRTAAPIDPTPRSIDDGWALSTAASEGLDATRLTTLSTAISSGQYGGVDALVIARNGHLCFDGYFSGTALDVHEMQSVTKSVTAALIGAAIARGAIASAQQPVVAALPAFDAAARDDPAKRQIRIEHFLTMSSGLDWDETSY